MASGPITSWHIDGETVETVRDLILGGFTIITDGDCSHAVAPWKHIYDQHRQHTKKQRHYFAKKGPSHLSYVFFQ